MKLICLSDLHLRSEAVVAAIDRQLLSSFLAQIAATVAEVFPDAVVVTGTPFPRARHAVFRNDGSPDPVPVLHGDGSLHLLLLLLGNCAEEVQPGQLLHPVDGNHESPQVSVVPFIRQHEADHLLRQGGIVDHFVIIFRHGDLVRTDGDGLFGRENRAGHDHDSLLPRGEVPDLFFQFTPDAPIKLRSLGRHIAHIETLGHRFPGERHVGGRGQMPAIIPAPGVVLRGRRTGRDGRIGAEVIAALRRPA